MDNPRKATIKDVAQLAGVHPSTVSRVLSGKSVIGDETVSRVRQAARDLGYRLHRSARKLVRGAQELPLVGVALTLVTHPFYLDIMKGIQEVLDPSRHSLMFFNLGPRPELIYQRILDEDLTGLILISHDPGAEFLATLQALGTTVVSSDCILPGIPSVVVDHELGGRLAARHLLENQCSRLVYLGEDKETPQQDQRVRGFRAALQEQDLELVLDVRIPMGEESARSCLEELLERNDWDGIFCYCDEMAYGAWAALGSGAPGRASLVGYDDLLPSRYLGLSTIRQPALEMGREAALFLQALWRGESAPALTSLAPELIRRRS